MAAGVNPLSLLPEGFTLEGNQANQNDPLSLLPPGFALEAPAKSFAKGATTELPETDTSSWTGDLAAGWESLKGAMSALDYLNQKGVESYALNDAALAKAKEGQAKALESMVQTSAKAGTIPQAPAARKFDQAKTFGEAWDAFLSDPRKVMRSTILRSAPASMPSVVGGILGSALGPLGAAGGAGAGSFAVELGSNIQDALVNAGVDLSNPEAVKKFWDANGKAIVTENLIRAGIISAGDALSGGIGAKYADAVTGGAVKKIIKGGLIGAATDAPISGGAEAVAQLATKGEINQPGAVAGEIVGGLGMGGIETVGQLGVQSLKGKAQEGPRPGAGPETPPPAAAPPEPATPLPEQVNVEGGQDGQGGQPPPPSPEQVARWRAMGIDVPVDTPPPPVEPPTPPADSFNGNNGQQPPSQPVEEQTAPQAAAPSPSEPVLPKVQSPEGAGPEVVRTVPQGGVREGAVDATDPLSSLPEGFRVIDGQGTRQSPVRAEQGQDLEVARAQVAEPTPAQAKAENTRAGHVRIAGLNITIETPQGKPRRWYDAEGNVTYESPPLAADYGRIKGTTGTDGKLADVYVGPNPQAKQAFVIDQRDPDTGKHDEYKALVGFDTVDDALRAYRNTFTDGRNSERVGKVEEMPAADLRAWLAKPPKPAPPTPRGPEVPFPGDMPPPKAADFEAPLPSAKRKYRRQGDETILQFIRRQGGLNDARGELAARNMRKGGLYRKDGLSDDDMRERLVQAGFISDAGYGTDRQAQSTENSVYDAIDAFMDEQKAGKRTNDELNKYSPQDRQFIQDHGYDIYEAATANGAKITDWSPELITRAKDLVQGQGFKADDAFELAADEMTRDAGYEAEIDVEQPQEQANAQRPEPYQDSQEPVQVREPGPEGSSASPDLPAASPPVSEPQPADKGTVIAAEKRVKVLERLLQCLSS